MTGWSGAAFIGGEEETGCKPVPFAAYADAVLDRVANELGINRISLAARSGMENPTDWTQLYFDRVIDRPTWRSHWYEIINDNNDPAVTNAAGFHFTFIDDKIDRIVNPLRQKLAARGERLYINVSYTDFATSPFEHSQNPAEYGEFMVALFQHLQQKYGWVPDAIELNVEPDNGGSGGNWTGTVLGAALVATGDRLKAAGFQPAFMAPSTTDAANAVPYLDQILQVPRARDYLTDVTYHRYAGASTAVFQSIVARALQDGLRTSMSEHIDSGYEDLYTDLTVGRNSFWMQNALAGCAALPNDGGVYYSTDPTNPTNPGVSLTNPARFLRQYFLFVRLGAVRIGAVSGDARFAPVAFRNANGSFVVVVKASAGGTFSVGGLPAGRYGVKYTTDSQSGVDASDVTIANGQALSASIPGPGVITVYKR